MKNVVSAEWLGFVAVTIAAGALSALFYYGHPLYLAAFALVGLVVGGYIVFMARLFGARLGMKIVLWIWAGTIVAMCAGEAYLRVDPSSQSDVSVGLLPAVVDKFERWRTSDVAQPWIDADYGVHIRDPDTLRDMASVLGDQFCRTSQFNAVVGEDNMFNINISAKLRDILVAPLNEQLLRNAAGGWLVRQKVAEYELESWKKSTQAGQEVLSKSRDPAKAELLRQFLDAQNGMISIYQARNDQWIPQFQVAQAMMEELLKVDVANDVKESDQALWDSLMKKNLDFGIRERNKLVPNPNSMQSQYNKKLKQLFGVRPDDPHVIPLPIGNCGYSIYMPNDVNTITPQRLIDIAQQIINQADAQAPQ
jgi:hypothetical protein